MVKSPFYNCFPFKYTARLLLPIYTCFITCLAEGQSIFKPNSVLAAGNWFKIAVSQAGVYKIDLALLNKLGINTSNLASNSIRIYGNGGQMVPEANADSRIDDLEENAVWVVDGGDGVLDGADYILFYSEGVNYWLNDSANQRFNHRKNLYSDKAFYYLTIGGTGKRIATSQLNLLPNLTVTSFNDRFFHELDTVNFLGSGKEWWGEEFANAPGKSLVHDFVTNIPGLEVNQPVTIISNCVARSIGASSRFDIRIKNQIVQQLTIPSIS